MSVEVKQVLLPAQEWEVFSKAYSADLLIESGADKVGGVRTHEFEGFLYTVMSISYLGSMGRNILEAWQLVPESLFTGEVFESRDWDALVAMGRDRGDFTGYKVKVKGKPMICTKEVSFVAAPPTVRPITLQEAQDTDAMGRSYGWRAHLFGEVEPTWKFHMGHPVAVYENERRLQLVLLWRSGRSVKEFTLADDTLLDEHLMGHVPTMAVVEPRKAPVQACLF